jgi:protein phosphatase
MIADEEIQRIVLEQRDLVEMAEALIRRANENGGKDNITVVLVKPFA